MRYITTKGYPGNPFNESSFDSLGTIGDDFLALEYMDTPKIVSPLRLVHVTYFKFTCRRIYIFILC